ncbi:HdeA/HdeB family chaperone [Kiloniella majae]|uniref:HdeA/HdeB family chaperone n=1 Tax=Kiloniella majae TaxID=1938558 RepID=UPI000A278FFF|nr:HdeA/HdeB family chaperone [Kiloniella majae]
MKNHFYKTVVFSLFLTVSIFNWPVIASEPSFKNVPCSAFDDEDDLMTFAFWLDGYLTGTQQKPIFDQEAIEPLLEATLTSCQSNPEKAVFQIVSDLKSS